MSKDNGLLKFLSVDKERFIEYYNPHIDEVASKYIRVAEHRRNYAFDKEDFKSICIVVLLEVVNELDQLIRKRIREQMRRCLEGESNSKVIRSEPLNHLSLLCKNNKQFREYVVGLPQQDKEILYLRMVNNYSFEEIGAYYSKSESWARKKCHEIGKSTHDMTFAVSA